MGPDQSHTTAPSYRRVKSRLGGREGTEVQVDHHLRDPGRVRRRRATSRCGGDGTVRTKTLVHVKLNAYKFHGRAKPPRTVTQ